jgi:chorismate mutase
VRHTVLFLAGTVLTGLIGTAPAAHADDPSPLYRLVDTAAQRLQTADPVAAFKWVKGGPIDDPPRSRQVVDSVGADATKQGIDPQPVRTIFTDQVHATEGIEYTRFGQWKLDPAAAPTTAPDLSASRAAIDGFNHQMVTEMALHRDSLRGPECGQQRDDAVRAVVMERQLDPLYQQALTFATHSYCSS